MSRGMAFLFGMLVAFLLVWGVIIATGAHAADLSPYLPDHSKTPGVTNPVLTESKLCAKGFRTGPYRKVSQATKNAVYRAYGMSPKKKPCPCEVDHLISLEIGGSNDAKNLWPQPYNTKPWNAHVKDKLEDRLHALVCKKQITLEQAQKIIATDWIVGYQRYVGAKP